MRGIGRQRRLRGPVILGMSAMVAIAVGGSLAATQASAAVKAPAAAHGYGGLSISKQYFGSTVEPYTGKETAVYRYTLSNAEGMSVKILTFGGILQAINVPPNTGREADVILGFKTLNNYVTEDSPPVTANGGPYFGELIGRYGNRIAKGTFTLNQPGVGPVTYHVPINNNGNSLHGGLVGFGNHIWSAKEVFGNGSVGLQLTLVSPNGDQGYPATLKDVTTFTLNNSDQLGIHYKLTNESSNLNTVTNVTDHAYFNLAGEASPAGSAYGQLLQINADKYTPTNATQIPLGYNVSVFGTPFNFTKPEP